MTGADLALKKVLFLRTRRSALVPGIDVCTAYPNIGKSTQYHKLFANISNFSTEYYVFLREISPKILGTVCDNGVATRDTQRLLSLLSVGARDKRRPVRHDPVTIPPRRLAGRLESRRPEDIDPATAACCPARVRRTPAARRPATSGRGARRPPSSRRASAQFSPTERREDAASTQQIVVARELVF